MSVLRILNGLHKGKIFPIDDREVYIGQKGNNDIVLKDAEISGRHAMVFTVGEMYFIRDLKSRQGTFVNNVRVQEELLYAGDKIKIGSINITFEDAATADKTPTKDIEYAEDDAQNSPMLELDLGDERKQEADDENTSEFAARNLEILYKCSLEFSELKDREELMQLTIKKLAKLLQADNIYIFLKDKQGDMAPKALFEREKAKIAPVSRGIIRRVLQVNKSVMTTDASSDERFRESFSIVRRKVKAVICAPLVSRRQTMGVIYIGASGATQTFVKADMELVTALARILATTMENMRAHRKHSQLLMNLMRSLVKAMELALPENRGHSLRVAGYAGAIAREMSLSPHKIYLCQMGGYIHDIGKIVINNLQAETEEDRENNYRRHVVTGEQVISEMEGMQELLPAIKYHHERHDGSGFPEGLTGENIPLIGCIVGLADCFDHMLTRGVDGKPLEVKDAIKELKNLADQQFRAEEVMALCEAYRKGHLKIAEIKE